MAIFSEEFTASVKSKVDSLKETITTKAKDVTKLSVTTLVLGGVVGSTLLVGGTAATARQIVGTNMGDECRIAADAYIELAEEQGKDLNKLTGYLGQVANNPWAALGLSGPITVVGERASERWDEIKVAETNYLGACVPDPGFESTVFGGYVEEQRSDKWEAEANMEEARDEAQRMFDRLGW